LGVEGILLNARVLNGRYAIADTLGCGGMGEVYLARDEFLGRNVALKILKEQYASSEEFRKRFRREAENAGSLSHPNVVMIYDSGEDVLDGTPYIAMEYVEGGTLAERIAREGPLDPFEAAEIARQVALALAESHRCGMVHRDVKPHNIFLSGKPIDTAGAVKVGDFGIARAAEATAITETSSILGSVRYLSPEQAMGEPVGPQSDLYSLGVVLYEMLTGRVLFNADGPLAVAMKHVSEAPPSLREANPDVPEDLEAITLTLLSKDPSYRYADALTLAEDLKRVGRGLTPCYAARGDATEALETPAPPSYRSRGGYSARPRDQRATAIPARRKRRSLRRRLSAAVMVGVLALVFTAGDASAILYNIPWPAEVRWVAEEIAEPFKEEPAPPLQEAVVDASEDKPEKAASEPSVRVETRNDADPFVQDSTLGFESTAPELATGTPPAPQKGLISDNSFEEFVEVQRRGVSASSKERITERRLEEAAVEETVRDHYGFIGARDFKKAYSYFGPTFRSTKDQQTWIADEKSYKITGSMINSLEVTKISDTTATVDVDVSFMDITGTPRFLITWKVVKEGGHWKLDEQVYAHKIR
jgi:hypothetical protein